MGMFVSGRVAITATGPIDEKDITSEMNVVFIRPLMDYGTRQRVIGAAAKIVTGTAGNRRQRRAAKKRGEEGRKASMDVDVGVYQIALLTHNILSWQGPAFMGVPCTPATIETLNAKEPLIARVIQEISDRNVDDDEDDEDVDEDVDPNVLELTATATAIA